MPIKKLLIGALAIAFLAGCTSHWIADPSQTTANLVNDLKLEGFACNAGFSSIHCKQIAAYVEKAPKVCTAEKGCIKQQCHDVRLTYEITQAADGLPKINQTIERTITRKIETDGVNSAERVQDLNEFCAL